MIRTIQLQFGPGRFALGPHRDRSAQEHALELFNYLLDRKLTVKQIQQLVFQGVISHRTVHLLGMFVPSALLPQSLARRLRQHTLHIAQEQRRKKILTHRFGCLSAEILQIQPTLHHCVKGFVIPSVVIDDQKLLARIPLLIQQRGGQDLQFAAGQPYTDKTHRQFQRQAQSSQLRSLIGRRQQPHRLAATGSIHAKQFLRRSKRTARTTRDVVQSQMMMPSQIGIAREASVIHQHISRLAQGQLLDGQLDLAQPGDVLVNDRGFTGYAYLAWHHHLALDYISRCSSGSFAAAQELFRMNRAGRSKTVRLLAPADQRAQLRGLGLPLELTVRFVSVRLPSGELEVLATSLLDEQRYPSEEFLIVYHYRWNHETFYAMNEGSVGFGEFQRTDSRSGASGFFCDAVLVQCGECADAIGGPSSEGAERWGQTSQAGEPCGGLSRLERPVAGSALQ